MPLKKEALSKEAKFLEEIEKVRDVIKKKHQLLKLGKESISETANEYLKPVIGPLENIAAKITPIINNKKSKISKDNTYDSEREEDSIISDRTHSSNSGNINTEQNLSSDEETEAFHDTIEDLQLIEQEADETGLKNDLTTQYLNKIDTLQWDKDYGVKRKNSGEYKIGNAELLFENNNMIVADETYEITQGLLELLFMKSPEKTKVTQIDEKNYAQILLNTNAHLRYHNSKNTVKNSASQKYITFILPHMKSTQHHGSGLLPTNMIIQSKNQSKVNYVYWDNPNELVDRLRLLVASRTAGNPSHDNEIMSIIEELREANIIH
ncbi:uncharacterized protein LOC122856358 [Aphidius gifuensis]|uniref:uncharacterized protein LOC122856358 n=1 Tax=Aphidius gifuensis TaxID=684658 RepID=UPI001CDCDEAC|nr:uncharacterized protein LOC122856358 [Aphidius gifuensis]